MARERKASAIYQAVFDEMMDLRVSLSMRPAIDANELDRRIAGAMDRAATKAAEAYREPLQRPASAGEKGESE